jgi:hypothetical protein
MMRRFTSSEETDQVINCFFNELQRVHMEGRLNADSQKDEVKMSMAGMCAILHNVRPEARMVFCEEMVRFLSHSEDSFRKREPERLKEHRDQLSVMVKDIFEKVGDTASPEDIEKELTRRINESGLPFDVKVMSLEKISISGGKLDRVNNLDIHGLRKMLAEADEHSVIVSKEDDKVIKKYKKGDV